MKTKIITAPNEIESTLIKGALENVDIKSWIIQGEDAFSFPARSRSQNVPCDVFVDEKDFAKALKLIKEIKHSSK